MKNRTGDRDRDRSRNGARLVMLLAGVAMTAAYRIIKAYGPAGFMYAGFASPLHSFLAGLCDKTRICVGEILIILVALSILADLISELLHFFRHPVRSIVSVLLIPAASVSFIYGAFCMLWGFYYAAPGVEGICGISVEGVEHDDLIAADRYFLSIANEYSDRVERGTGGCYEMTDEAFEHSLHLYDKVSGIYPGLESRPHRPKKVFFSKAVSLMDFTGFFFPFTGEACINDDSPDCMKPSTIAHELAHQRGIAAEDEANFIGILACMEDGDPEYVYSASLLALIHLQNALYDSGDKDTWQDIRDSYSEGVVADLKANSEYWSAYRDNKMTKAASETYEAFLKSYDQEKGLETYGACVDYLVYYYAGKGV